MIHPRMATMLAVVLTDAAVDPAVLAGLLPPPPSAPGTSCPSTATRAPTTRCSCWHRARRARRRRPARRGANARRAIEAVARDLARQQAADGEGAATLITCQVTGARDDAEARAVARAVVSSSLVKAGGPRPRPELGADRRSGRERGLADAAVLEAAGLPAAEATARRGSPVVLDPDRLRIAIAGISSTTERRRSARLRSSGARARWTRRGC